MHEDESRSANIISHAFRLLNCPRLIDQLNSLTVTPLRWRCCPHCAYADALSQANMVFAQAQCPHLVWVHAGLFVNRVLVYTLNRNLRLWTPEAFILGRKKKRNCQQESKLYRFSFRQVLDHRSKYATGARNFKFRFDEY